MTTSKAKQITGKLVAVNQFPEDPPEKTRAQAAIKNARHREKRKRGQSIDKCEEKVMWTVSDLNDLLVELGYTPEANQDAGNNKVILLGKQAYVDDNGKQQWWAAFSTLELLATPQRCRNPGFINIGTDATFRDNKDYNILMAAGDRCSTDDECELIDNNVALTTIVFGIIGKEYARTTMCDTRQFALRA